MRYPLSRTETQIQLYQNHLRNSLKPQKEPGNFGTIIDDSVYRNALQTQMESSHVGESLARTYLLDFDSQTSALKDEFRDDYQKGFCPSSKCLCIIYIGEIVAR